MEADSDIEAMIAAEQVSLGFFAGTTGAAVSALLGWIASAGLSPARDAAFSTAVLSLWLFVAWFGAQWRLVRGRRPALFRELCSRAPRP